MNSGIFFGCIAALVAVVMLWLAARVRIRPTHAESDYLRGCLISFAAGMAITLTGIAVMLLKPEWFS